MKNKFMFFVYVLLIFFLGIVSAQLVESSKPDLIVKNLRATPYNDIFVEIDKAGRETYRNGFTIEFDVENVGDAPINEEFYLNVLLDGHSYAKQIYQGRIEVKEFVHLSFEYPHIVGVHELNVKVDSYIPYAGETTEINLDNLINELNEANNEISGTFKLNSEYQNAQWECNDGRKQQKSADCWRKDVFRGQAERDCGEGGVKTFGVLTECEYIASVCGDNICSKGEGKNCEQIASQSETTSCYIKCPLDCGVGFTNAQWQCFSEEQFIKEDKDNCNSYETWQGLAIQACESECNEEGQCGLVINSIKLSEECGEPFWTKISNWFLKLFGRD